MPFLFFSAKQEQEKIDAMERAAAGIDMLAAADAAAASGALDEAVENDDDHDEDGDDDEGDETGDDDGAGSEGAFGAAASAADASEVPVDPALAAKCRVVGRDELIDFLIAKQAELVPLPEEGDGDDDETDDADDEKADSASGDGSVGQLQQRPVVVGMVGYPNVGKSSTINALMGASTLAHGVKRVSVGNTPGKTKHFQVCVLCAHTSDPCVSLRLRIRAPRVM